MRNRSSLISQIAHLESRRMLSAVIDGNWLRVTGTNQADEITVRWIDSPSRVEVTINEDVETFASNLVGAISIDGLEGDDLIRNQVGKSNSVVGGAGNDTIFGGAGRSYLYGGAGDDSLVGGSRVDLIYGDRDSESGPTLPGNDTMVGNGDNDWFYSDEGSDFIDGGSDIASNESLEYYDVAYYVRRTVNLSLSFDGIANDGASAETGNLINVEGISSGSGNDLLVGNDRSNVTVLGGLGNDTIKTLSGNDTIWSDEGGSDLIDAGSGNDIIFPPSGWTGMVVEV
ncbi:MAG TPA: calcium-binding protein, partial [Tepidisphaeraceae bacterium]|nr:calcium-binding protein [Tepidisphaeraceae bacterium]